MIIVHHLNNSRSQRILWLLEELAIPYELKLYQRDPKTNLAPPELKAINALGKSPVIEDGTQTLIESAAIIDYLIRRHGQGRLQPDPVHPRLRRIRPMAALRRRLGHVAADVEPVCRTSG